jgi:dihydroorotase-like cyclic amidohydrolase
VIDLLLTNAEVVTPSGVVHGDVAVDGGRIVAVGQDAGDARRVIDVDGRIVMPGVFDPHVHFGLAGTYGDDTMLEDFRHNTRDCLVGGVTTVATTTLPGADLVVEYERTAAVAVGHSWCDYRLVSIVGRRPQVAQIREVVARGGTAFKFFTGMVGNEAVALGGTPEGIPPDFFLEACDALRATGSGAFPMIHAEEPSVRGALLDRVRRSGRADHLVAWADASPAWAESAQIYGYGLVARQARVPLYPVHLSAAESIDTVAVLQSQGFDVPAETVVHYLCTTADEIQLAGLGVRAKVQPPIRFERDRQRLWRGIAEGTIKVVGTDSGTYSLSMRQGPDFWECRVGLPLQVADTLPLMYTEGVAAGHIDLLTLSQVLSANAARLHGIYPRKGAIAPGSDADIVVIDQHTPVRLGAHRYRGHTDYTLWEGREVTGVPVMTFLRGKLVMQDGEIVDEVPTGVAV